MSDSRFWKDEFDKLTDDYHKLKAELNSCRYTLLEIVDAADGQYDKTARLDNAIEDARAVLEKK